MLTSPKENSERKLSMRSSNASIVNTNSQENQTFKSILEDASLSPRCKEKILIIMH
jgi:hypothetical protein